MGTLPRAHRMSLASAQFSRACAPAAMRASRRGRRSTVGVRAGVFDVTVSDTKQKFLQAYPYPIPSVWSTITQELLVQGHFAKYNVKSEYNALGSVSVFDQLYEGFPSEEEKGKIFSAFLSALGEDPVKTRADAETLGAFASSADGVEGLKTNPIFASTKEKSDAGK